MEDEIISKLRLTLGKPITEECQVVYIMVEMRKLLDRTQKGYPLLRFYCNWVVHIDIDKISAAREILEKISEEHKNGKFADTELEFIKFDHLRVQISQFLNDFDLPKDLAISEEKWRKFKIILANVLVDCPLKIKVEPIEEFVFKKAILSEDSDDVDWEIKFPNDPMRYGGSLTDSTPLVAKI